MTAQDLILHVKSVCRLKGGKDIDITKALGTTQHNIYCIGRTSNNPGLNRFLELCHFAELRLQLTPTDFGALHQEAADQWEKSFAQYDRDAFIYGYIAAKQTNP